MTESPKIPEQVREFLGNQFDYHSFQFQPTDKLRPVQDMSISQWQDIIVPYYKKWGITAVTYVYNFIVEPLKNANFHGGRGGIVKERPVINLELFLSPKSLVASYQDGGIYFKRQEVKTAWESKTPFPEKHIVPEMVGVIGGGAGQDTAHDLADLIHVDIVAGKLYVGALTSGRLFKD